MSTFETSVVRARAKNSAFIADLQIVTKGESTVLYLVGGTNHEPTILASTDAVHFHKKKTPETSGLRALLPHPDGRLFVCGEYGALHVSSDDGDTWEAIATEANACLFAIVRDARGGLWVSGDEGFVLRSTDDGKTWTSFDIGTKERIGSVVSDGDDVYFLCADGALIALREEKLQTLYTGTGPLTDLRRSKHGLFVTGDRGQLLRSTNGTDFTLLEAVGKDVDLEAIAIVDDAVFVVGARGTALRSIDGKKFELIDSTVRDHLYSVVATGAGVFIGGEGGGLLHIRPPGDATWANKADTLAEKPGELDAMFLEGGPDTFVYDGLPTLVGGVGTGQREWEKHFEAVWGTKIPDEIAAFLRAVEKGGTSKVLHEWRPESGILDNPAPEENVFEQIVARDQEAYLGTGLVEVLAGQLYLGTYGNGDSHLASIYGDAALGAGDEPKAEGARTLHIFDHEEHNIAFATGTSVSRFAYFSALCNAIREQKISERAAKTALDRVRGSITPSWHFESTIEESGADALEGFKDERPFARIWYARGLWIVYLLRADGVVDVEDVKRMFFPNHNPPLTGEVHERWMKSSQRLVPTALYCMLRCFFFDDPKLEGYLAIGRAHKSRLARDCAQIIDDTLAGKRKGLGKIADLLALRTRFQKLDLDPAREEQRKAEAAERARAIEKARADARERAATLADPAGVAWSQLEDLPMHEAIEARLRSEPALAATFSAIDFVLGQKYVRDNLVLKHEMAEELEWLGLHGDPSVVPLLVGAFVRPPVPKADEKEEEEEKTISITAGHANTIGEMLTAFAERERLDKRAIAALRPVLDRQEKYEWRRAHAVTLLGHLGDVESLPKLHALAAWVPSDDYGEAIARKDLAKALAQTFARLRDARAIPTLTKMIENKDKTSKDAWPWAAEALGELGGVDAWREVLLDAGGVDRKPASWLLWSVGMLGAKANDETKQKIVAEVQSFKPKWNVFYLDLIRAGVLARLGARPDDFATVLEQAFTKPGWDAETTSMQEAWALRIIGVTDASTHYAKQFLLRDDPMLRNTARDALERRGEKVPPARFLHRAEVARIEAEGGVTALIAAFNDETAIYRHVAASRLGALRATAAREGLIRHARGIVARTPREVGAKLTRDMDYPLRWSVKALITIGQAPEVTELLGDLLVHPSREVKDPVLRYVDILPDDAGLIEPMLRVADEKYGWQESTANKWLEKARERHPRVYDEALERLRRPS